MEVMKDAGLTHGAFYGYFPFKEALIAEALGRALPPVPDGGKPQRPTAEYADSYLSARHRDNRATFCLFSSLGTEAARGSAELRHPTSQCRGRGWRCANLKANPSALTMRGRFRS